MIALSIVYLVIITAIYLIEEYRIKQLRRAYDSLLKTLEKQIEKP